MSHFIADTEWTPKINLLRLRCGDCGCLWLHRSDRWISICPTCGSRDNLEKVREKYVSSLTFEKS